MVPASQLPCWQTLSNLHARQFDYSMAIRSSLLVHVHFDSSCFLFFSVLSARYSLCWLNATFRAHFKYYKGVSDCLAVAPIRWGHLHGHNFGQKSGVSIQKENETLLGPETTEGKRTASSPRPQSDLGVWESVVSCHKRDLRRSPSRKLFYCNLITADRLYWQQILHLLIRKSGVWYPQSKKWGTGLPVPLVHHVN